MTFLLDQDTPDDLAFSLLALDHHVIRLRDVLPVDTPDDQVLEHAHREGCVLITCNRDDFVALARSRPHSGLIILIRRRTRARERAALVRLLDAAGEPGILGNINFA